jgi:hypothetical protein
MKQGPEGTLICVVGFGGNVVCEICSPFQADSLDVCLRVYARF